MAIDTAPGYPNYEADGNNKNIPWIFSKKTVAKFYDKAVAPYTANTDYEGEIKSMGDKVVINTVPSVTITAYQKGGTVAWENLESPSVELTIDRAATFAFRFDKIDLHQFAVKMMDKCSDDAAEQMKIHIDTAYINDIYADASSDNKGTTAGRKSSSYNLGTTGSAIGLTKSNIIDTIMAAEAVAEEQNWPESGRWIVLPTWASYLLNISDLRDASITGLDKSYLVGGGYLGGIGKFKVYTSNLYSGVTDGANTCYNITFGHMSGVTFAAQLTEMEYHEKFENTFGSGMKGLQVYDWKVVKPESLGVLYAYKA